MKKNQSHNSRNQTGKDFDLLVVGEINVDLILKGNIDPVFGQVEKVVDQAALTIGSSAAIFACGAARLGLKTAFTGIAGDDAFGRFMIEELGRRGVDTSGIQTRAETATGISVILVKGQDRAILTFPGSIPELKSSDIDRALLARSRHLHLSSFFLLDQLRPDIPDLFREARGLGLSVSLDTNFDPRGKWDGGLREVLVLTDILLPNAAEAKAITGEESLENALARLNAGTPIVAVKLGAEGAVAAERGCEPVRQAAQALEVVDTVGAGDSFDAGFLYGFLNGMDVRGSLRLGVVCGCLSTRAAGGTDAQPRLEEALKFASQLR